MGLQIFFKSNTPYPGKRSSVAGQKLCMLFGQSNASGSGQGVDLPADLTGPIANAKIFNIATKEWQILEYGVNTRCDLSSPTTNTTFGIELRLMKLLAANTPGIDQYILKYTQQGTQLANSGSSAVTDWNVVSGPAPELFANSTEYYNRARIKNPIDLPASWLIWMQGENDSGDINMSTNYQTNLTNFINNIRSVYGLPNLKIILVSLSTGQTSLNSTNRSTINTAMQNIAGSLTNIFYYSQNNPTADGTHYGAASLDNIATGVYNIIAAN